MNRIMARSPGASLAALITLLLVACTQAETKTIVKGIDAAETAYFQFDLKKASQLFTHVWEDQTASPEDRAKAGRQLARMAAFIHQDQERARDLIKSVEATGVEESLALLNLAQIEREVGNYGAAMDAANRAATSAETRLERYDAYVEFSRTALAQAVDQILEGKSQALEHERLAVALSRIDTVLQEQRGLMTPSLVALELALILGKGSKALEAWRSYFHIRPGTKTTSVLEEPAEVLERILPTWQGEAMDEGGQEELILALAGSRMYEAARLVAMMTFEDGTSGSPQISEIIAYHDYLENIGGITRGFYRESAVGRGDDGAYKEDLERRAKILWSQLQWSEDPPPFSRKQFEKEIGGRFGAEITFKRISGYFGLHMGHRVADEDYHVEQYGNSAALRFISLDFIVSNGYTSWFWDGRAQVGGWAANPIIIQIRTAYADQGIDAWKAMSDSKKREKTEREIAEYEPVDIELARQKPNAFLPGLAKRIKHNSHRRLLTELRAMGLEDSDLRLAFIAEIERIDLESSIIAHEGRHAIDSRSSFSFLRRGAEKEFRAKLSEVAFSSAPFLAMGGGILAHNIGDGSAHGEANERILKGVVEWMKEHGDTIDNLDPEIPLLPQLDRLTDEQLREAFRSMDPMAS